MYYIDWDNEIVLGFSKKCASTSISRMISRPRLRPLALSTVVGMTQSGVDSVGLIRDPIDRCESAYNFFKYGNNAMGGRFPNGKHYCDIHNFYESITKGYDKDDHWTPQSDHVGLCKRFVDLETFPIDRHENATQRREFFTEEEREGLKIYYMADYEKRGNSWKKPEVVNAYNRLQLTGC